MSEIRVVMNDTDAIKYAMTTESINHVDLARKMGCQRQYITQILNRNKSGVRFDSFIKIMNELGYEVCIRKVESDD